MRSLQEHSKVKSISRHPNKNSACSNIIFLFGPTGVGKTELLLDLDPQRFSVINADSIQVYRFLDIGSAKASKAIQSRIEHHLIDIQDPWDQFSVGQFIEQADLACRTIEQAGKIPVMSGGTAYYFKHFLYGLSEAPPSNEQIRSSLNARIEQRGRSWAFSYLKEIDPVSAARIHPSDMYRVSRALEVWETSNKPLSSYAIPNMVRPGLNPLVIGLKRDHEILHDRIALRVQQMFDEGLEDEIRMLLDMGAKQWWPGLQGIGYREFFQAMESGEWSRSSIAQQIVRNSRLYAKRQLTFFRSFTQAKWYDPTDKETILTEIEKATLLPLDR